MGKTCVGLNQRFANVGSSKNISQCRVLAARDTSREGSTPDVRLERLIKLWALEWM